MSLFFSTIPTPPNLNALRDGRALALTQGYLVEWGERQTGSPKDRIGRPFQEGFLPREPEVRDVSATIRVALDRLNHRIPDYSFFF